MPIPWFFSEVLPAAGGAVALDWSEARHALGSRRLVTGDEVMLFDGRGGLARAAIEDAGQAVFARVRAVSQETPAAREICLASALPKGDRAAVMLSMATQLGMSSFTPLLCARSEVEAGRNSAERWQRIMIEACKQSRRLFLPKLNHAAAPAEIVAGHRHAVLFAHPGGQPLRAALETARDRDLAVLVGPEGGFTDEEVHAMSAASAMQVDLGPAILRIETAAALMVGAAMLTAQESVPAE